MSTKKLDLPGVGENTPSLAECVVCAKNFIPNVFLEESC